METNYSRLIKEKIARMKPGSTFQYDDFHLSPDAFHILATLLSSMVRSGQLVRISRGNFMIPDPGSTDVSPEKLVADFLKEGRKQTCYLTGQRVFHRLGLTPENSKEIVLGTNNWRPPVERMGIRIKFVPQSNKISRYKIPYLQVLDAIKEVKSISGSHPDQVSHRLMAILSGYGPREMHKLIDLSMEYNPATRALTGALAEELGHKSMATLLRSTLNPFSIYNLHISGSALPNRERWRIS